MQYEVRLKEFEGPLDLLLHLIKKAKINLEDIFVSEITSQYLEYMEQISDIDLDKASEFLNMAATLIYIKSRSLLPKHDMDEEEIDPETMLIERLRVYRVYKEITHEFKIMEESGGKVFYKLQEESIIPAEKINLEGATLDALYDAFARLVEINKEKESYVEKPITISADVFTIKDRIQYISRLLKTKRRINFHELFKDTSTRLEIVVTFIALLELLNENRLTIVQENHFQEIVIQHKEQAKVS